MKKHRGTVRGYIPSAASDRLYSGLQAQILQHQQPVGQPGPPEGDPVAVQRDTSAAAHQEQEDSQSQRLVLNPCLPAGDCHGLCN